MGSHTDMASSLSWKCWLSYKCVKLTHKINIPAFTFVSVNLLLALRMEAVTYLYFTHVCTGTYASQNYALAVPIKHNTTHPICHLLD